MSLSKNLTPSAKTCLDWLKADLANNIEMNINSSLTPLYERAIDRASELNDFFEDVHNQLEGDSKRLILEMLVDADWFWHPKQARKIRSDYQKFEESNRDIFRTALKLAQLLEERSELSEGSSWSSYADTNLSDILYDTSKDHTLFNSFLMKSFKPLLSYGSKYWPSTVSFVEELRNRFCDIDIEAGAPAHHLLIKQSRASDLDTIILFFSDLQTRKTGINGLPNSFRLRDTSVASAINIGLDLPDTQLFTAEKVKGSRQILRKKGWDVWGERYCPAERRLKNRYCESL